MVHMCNKITCSIARNRSAKDALVIVVVGHEPRQVGEESDYAKEFKIYPVGNEELSKGF